MTRPSPTFVLFLSFACFGLSIGALAAGTDKSESKKEAEIRRGKDLFVKATCWGCHAHGDNAMHPDKPLKGPAFEKQFQNDEEIVKFVRKGSKFGMPPFPKSKLSDSDLQSIIVYIRSLSPTHAK